MSPNIFYDSDTDPYSDSTMVRRAYDTWTYFATKYDNCMLTPPHTSMRNWHRRLRLVRPHSHVPTFAALSGSIGIKHIKAADPEADIAVDLDDEFVGL
jgi:hypothetical protein